MTNESNLTLELLEKAKSATNAAALLALAQENGSTLTAEEATLYFAQLHPKAGALSDEELDNVSGGCGDQTGQELAVEYVKTNHCGKKPRCYATKVTNLTERNFYTSTPTIQKKLCHSCGHRGAIDAHCREMGWPIFESASPVNHLF